MADKIKFKYHIKDAKGNYKEDVILATSVEALKQDFNKRGFTFLREPEPVVNTGLNTEINIGFLKKRIKRKEIALFARKFSVMQDAGIPIKKIMSVLGNNAGMSPKLRETVMDLQEQINAGIDMSDAMEKHPEVFDKLFVSMVRAGEQGGFLDKSMRQVAENLEAEIKLKAKIKSAMTYPVVVLGMALLMCVGMLLFIVPVFEEMFASLGGELPLPTQVLVYASDFMKVAIFPLIGVIGVFMWWWKKNKRKERVRAFVDPWKIKIPVMGKLFEMIALSRYNRNLSTLLDNGVPILRSMEIVGETTGNIIYEKAVMSMRANLKRGDNIGQAMTKETVFPNEDIEMVKVGDDAGDVTPMLKKISDMYDDDVETTTEALTSLMEPILIVFLGVVVGAMVVALYMPIFSIGEVVQQSAA